MICTVIWGTEKKYFNNKMISSLNTGRATVDRQALALSAVDSY